MREFERVCVVGLGYVGLPLAVEFAKAGLDVTGIDLDEGKVRAIGEGRSLPPDVDAEALERERLSGRLKVEASYDPVEGSDAVIICVPTPLNPSREPDLSHVRSAAEEVEKRLPKGCLVVLESTTYPGTTEEVLLPILSRGGRKVGEDFFLAYSPERIDPGRRDYTLRNTPKVVAGVTERCLERAVRLYSMVVERLVPVSSPKVAEMTKIFENVFRNVNIALVNELALLCHKMGISVWEVLDAAQTKPFGFTRFNPGPGVGGHCIPVDPFYLSWKAKQYNFRTRFIELAGEVNASMPEHVVQRIADILNERERSVKGSRILILGVAYKRDCPDTRESPAIDIIEGLMRRGAKVEYLDPWVPEIEVRGEILRSKGADESPWREADLVVLVTDHSNFDYERIAGEAGLIFDTRNAFGSRGLKGDNIIPL